MSFAKYPPTNATGSHPLTGWMVLGALLAFFGTVAAVNAAMIYYAVSTFRGEQEAKPYEHGLAYGKDIEAAQVQDELHWEVSAKLSRADASRQASIEIAMKDAQEQDLTGLTVNASLDFATDKKLDRHIALTETTPGHYRGELAVIRDGQWNLVIEAGRDGKRVFLSRNRVALH